MSKHSGDHTSRGVEVHGTNTRVRRDGDIGREAAHERFGGIDIPASLVGMLAAIAMIVLLGGLVAAAIGAFGYQMGATAQDAEELGIAGVSGAVVTLFIAFLVGGWAAARMARYDGVRNGIMTVVWTVLLSAAFAIAGAVLGAQYNVFERVDLPRWSTSDEATTAGIVSLVVAALVALASAALGGWIGERYHRRADATIASTRDGGIAQETTTRGTVGGI